MRLGLFLLLVLAVAVTLGGSWTDAALAIVVLWAVLS